MNRKHGFLLFIATCIPGCGQMYQGYMKRGVSLLAVLCGVATLAMLLQMGELTIFLPLVWLFAFFDSYNLRGQSDEQAAANPDAYLFGLSTMDSERMTELLRRRHSLIGWALVILGFYALFNMVVRNLMNVLSQWMETWWLQRLLLYSLPRIAGTVLLIGLGLWFIRGPKSKPQVEEDFAAFTPPASEQEGGHEDA